jgi:hypothetical protein
VWNVDRHRRGKEFSNRRVHRPRAIARSGAFAHYKAVFNLRGDDGAATGGLAVELHLQVCKFGVLLLPEAPATPCAKPAAYIGPRSNILRCRSSVEELRDCVSDSEIGKTKYEDPIANTAPLASRAIRNDALERDGCAVFCPSKFPARRWMTKTKRCRSRSLIPKSGNMSANTLIRTWRWPSRTKSSENFEF